MPLTPHALKQDLHSSEIPPQRRTHDQHRSSIPDIILQKPYGDIKIAINFSINHNVYKEDMFSRCETPILKRTSRGLS